MTHIQMLADQIAGMILPGQDNYQKRDTLMNTIVQLAYEIKREAIEP